MPSLTRSRAAFKTCEILLAPGKKWRLSPYVESALTTAGLSDSAFLVPIFQSVTLDLLAEGRLPSRVSILDLGSPEGLGALAALDALLAWHTACTLYQVPAGVDQIHVQLEQDRSLAGHRLWRLPRNLLPMRRLWMRQGSLAGHKLWRAFRDALQSRAGALPALACLSSIAQTADDVSAALSLPPNLVLWPFSEEQNAQVESLLDRLPDGAIVVGVTWQGKDHHLFRWRHELLQRRQDLITLGPCGQEYGRDLPKTCLTCSHGRREAFHCPDLDTDPPLPAWTYVILAKRTAPADPLTHELLSTKTLQQVVTGDVHLRYVGTYRESLPSTTHPDDANDDPSDQEWREYLKVCPGHSGATRVAVERRAGMQTPRLQYGQWLHVRDLRPRRPYARYPDIYTLRVQNEAAFHTVEGLPVDETFVRNYTPEVRAAVDEAGYRLFGFAAMRDFQHTILAQVLCGGDIFAIAATGGGKSECYILPAMLLPGLTVVVSPLKSLILDQYEQRIRDRYGLDYLSTFINSDILFYERQGRLRRMVLGHFRLVYLTPEQLERGYVLDALRQADQRVGLRYLALDEAHCISQWGHDFRPSYLNIVQRLQDYGLKPHRIALTATASPLVRDDVCDELHLDHRDLLNGGDVFIDSSNRPELNFVVHRARSTKEKARIIIDAIRQLGEDGSAIVFMPHTGGTPQRPHYLGAPKDAPTQANVGMVSPGVTPFARYLSQQLGQPVALYHGALDNEAPTGQSPVGSASDDDSSPSVPGITRQTEQRAFMSGQKRIMVATKGFGMGVDKPDIRLVIHRSPPANLEAYVQEAGRAGRDGELATVMLLVSDDRPEITGVPIVGPKNWTTC